MRKRVSILSSGFNSRTSCSAATLVSACVVVTALNAICFSCTFSSPNAWRVAVMLWAMNADSLSFLLGLTTNDCTTAG